MPTQLPTLATGRHLVLQHAQTHGLQETATRLLAEIETKYKTMTELLDLPAPIGPLVFTRPSDPEAVLDELAEAATTGNLPNSSDYPVRLPYWAEVWDSALGMCQWLANHPPARQHVLDLGCGLGLTGAVACALGANVTLADIEPPALLFAALNTLGLKGTATTALLDWRTGTLPRSFDLILGADIVYERSQRDYLEPFFRKHLAPKGTILLGEPGRQTGDEFLTWLDAKGWVAQSTEVTVISRPAPIRLVTLRPVK